MRKLWPAENKTADVRDDDALARLYAYPDPLRRPWVKANFISSVDGAVSVGGRSAGLSDANDKRIFQLGRELADVILVGAGTVLTERYRGVKPTELSTEARRRYGLAPIPPIAVVTRRCSIEPTSLLLTDTVVAPLVFTTAAAPSSRREALTEAGADVVVAGDADVDLRTVLTDLDRRGLRRVCCEGGPQLFGSLIADDLVDELCLSLAPLLAAGDAGRIANGPLPPEPIRMRLASVLYADDLLMMRYLRR